MSRLAPSEGAVATAPIEPAMNDEPLDEHLDKSAAVPEEEVVSESRAAAFVRQAVQTVLRDPATASVVALYCLCSATMLVVNKMTTVYMPHVVAFITLCQFASTAAYVIIASKLGKVELDPFDWQKFVYFVPYSCAFAASSYASMRVLAVSNVETIIVFRACAPLVVSGFDYVFHKRALPGMRSSVAMLVIAVGAGVYAWAELVDHSTPPRDDATAHMRRMLDAATGGVSGASGLSEPTAPFSAPSHPPRH